jgi:hypothetical protein
VLRWRSAGVMALSLAGGLATVLVLAAPNVPRSLQLTGHSGHLAEWSLVANLTNEEAGGTFVGALTLEHTGLCSLDGPEKKSGEMQLRLARFGSAMQAKVLIDGVECAYEGALSDVYTGMLTCPGSRPVPLTVWIN